MPIPVRPRFETCDPSLRIETTDDGSRTLVRSGVPFHSGCGAVSECDWVYLHGGGMTRQADSNWPHRILEIGFGTGMAMLRSVDRAIMADQPLSYIAVENQPVDASILRQLKMDRDDNTPGLTERFLDQWERWFAGDRNGDVFRLEVDSKRQVQVHIDEATRWLCSTGRQYAGTIDTVYFDPFDPEVAPDLWQQDVMANLYACLRPGGRLVTYCVRGQVRRRLSHAGFIPDRVPGPPAGKREVLIATKPG